jgi:hypothetical protein
MPQIRLLYISSYVCSTFLTPALSKMPGTPKKAGRLLARPEELKLLDD